MAKAKAKPKPEAEPFGDYVIVAFEIDDPESEALTYYTIDWNFKTEADAWAALGKMQEAGQLDPGDYGVIRICGGRPPVSVR